MATIKSDDEPAKYTQDDKLYLRSIRNKPWPQSHPDVVWVRDENKRLNLVTVSSIYGQL